MTEGRENKKGILERKPRKGNKGRVKEETRKGKARQKKIIKGKVRDKGREG